MRDLIREIDAGGVQGAIVETGCWKGGLGAYMAQFGRPVWLFDSFEGLPPLSEKDIDIAAPHKLELHVHTGYISVPEESAHEIARKLNVKPHIIKGWFSDTLPKYKEEIGKIAILRMDGDTYESTKQTLDTLYGQVVKGGIVVIDDYDSFSGCREAVYEYFVKNKTFPSILRYPGGKAYFKKP